MPNKSHLGQQDRDLCKTKNTSRIKYCSYPRLLVIHHSEEMVEDQHRPREYIKCNWFLLDYIQLTLLIILQQEEMLFGLAILHLKADRFSRQIMHL